MVSYVAVLEYKKRIPALILEFEREYGEGCSHTSTQAVHIPVSARMETTMLLPYFSFSQMAWCVLGGLFTDKVIVRPEVD